MRKRPARGEEDGSAVMSFGEHLEELRRRLFRSVLVITIASLIAFYFQDPILEWVAGPHRHATRGIAARAEAVGIRDDCARLAQSAAAIPPGAAARLWRKAEESRLLSSQWERQRADLIETAALGTDLAKWDLIDARLRALEWGSRAAELWREVTAAIALLDANLNAEIVRASSRTREALTEAGTSVAALRKRCEGWQLEAPAESGDPDFGPLQALFAGATEVRERLDRLRAGDLAPQPLKVLGYPDSVIAHMKVCIIVGLLATMPWIVFELWGFIAVGLYRHERRSVYPFLPVSMLLLVAGAIFGYYVLVPIGLDFLGSYGSPDLLEPSFTLQSYLSLLIVLLMGLGLLFQLPLIMLFLARAGLVQAATFRQYRKAAIVGSLIFAAALTPPDVVSQLLLGIPTIVLYEIGILLGAIAEWRKAKTRTA